MHNARITVQGKVYEYTLDDAGNIMSIQLKNIPYGLSTLDVNSADYGIVLQAITYAMILDARKMEGREYTTITMDSRIVTSDARNVEIVYVLNDNRDIVCYRYDGKGRCFMRPRTYVIDKIESGEWILER